jgi:RNA methyltransferase, TrmH family
VAPTDRSVPTARHATPSSAPVGPRHPSVARVRRLARRSSARRDEGRLVIDGPTLLGEALDAGIGVEEVLLDVAARPDVVEVAERAGRCGASLRVVADGVLERAADTVTPNGVVAVVERPEVGLDAALASAVSTGLALVLVGVGDPGNAGTLLRAAEAAGVGAVLFSGGSVDPGNPKCVRASAGALFHVPVAVGGEAVEVLEEVAGVGLRRAGTVAAGGTPHTEVDLRQPTAIVLGSEAHGLPAGVDAVLDARITIPMVGRAESLNVAMAGSVLCFEALRQRRAEARS